MHAVMARKKNENLMQGGETKGKKNPVHLAPAPREDVGNETARDCCCVTYVAPPPPPGKKSGKGRQEVAAHHESHGPGKLYHHDPWMGSLTKTLRAVLVGDCRGPPWRPRR